MHLGSWLLAAMILAGCVDPLPAPPPPAKTAASSPARAPAENASAASAAELPAASSPPPVVPPKRWPTKVLTWDYDKSAVGKTRVVVVSPETTERLPVLVALHGLSEAHKGVELGARGWIDDYGLLTAVDRLGAPPLTKKDMQKLGTKAHLAAVNALLAKEPFRGLIVVCPYTPDILGAARSLDAAVNLGDFIANEVLPRVYKETPALGTPSATGIDGVSLGGRASLLVGLAHPDRFGVVGAMQAAIYGPDLTTLTQRVRDARARHPDMGLRLLTSSHDFYRPTIRKWSKALNQAGLDHDFELIDRGPHSYAFNRGLGVYAMLMFYDRALRRR